MRNIFRKAESPAPKMQSAVDLAEVFDSLDSPVLVIDREGITRQVNQAACTLAKRARKEILGRPVGELGDGRVWAKLAEQVELVQHLSYPLVCEIADESSAMIWEFTASLTADNLTGRHIILRGRDVTGRRQMEQTLHRQAAYLVAIQETTLAIMYRHDLKVQLQTLVSRACALTEASQGHIYLVEPNGCEMRLLVVEGSPSSPPATLISPSEGLAGKVWQRGEAVVINESGGKADDLKDALCRPLRAAVGVPLKSDSCVIGVLCVATTEGDRRFGEDEVEALNRFAELASISIDNAQMYRSVQQEMIERRRAEETNQDSVEKYKLLFQSNPLPLWVYDRETLKFLAVNDAAVRQYGYSEEEFLSMTAQDLRNEGNMGALLLSFAQSTSELTADNIWKHRKKDGSMIDVEITSHEVVYAGRPAILALMNNVTERKRAEVALQKREEHYRSLIENASDLILILNAHGTLSYVSPSVERALAYSPDELICRNLFEFLHPQDFSDSFSAISCIIETPGESRVIELRMRHLQGSWRVYEAICKCVLDEHGDASAIINARDITERKAAEEQLVHNAFHDPLTSLPNRRLFLDRLNQAIIRARRRSGNLYAVFFLDLDQFKLVNDSLGHNAGDELLVAISRRLQAVLREGDTIARMGGDEFAILVEDVEGPDQIDRTAERILQELTSPFTLGAQSIYTSASIGIALGSMDYDTPEEILRNADTAMYQAKKQGKSCHAVFDQNMHVEAVKMLRLRTDLRRAVENNEFYLLYQPILQLDSRGIIGFEALVRWNHPEFGMVPPGTFIAVAEESNLINDLGAWVLREACRQTREWQAALPGISSLCISVNLSVKQLAQPDLVEQFGRILCESGLAPECLKLEITESVFMEDPESTASLLWQLKQLGVQLQIDDFGTGYSSLSYLHKFPFDSLKIDKSFVSGPNLNPKNAEIVRTIVMLAHKLGMSVTAEGIETMEQFSQLAALGCEHGQGYLLSEPVEGSLAGRLIASQHKERASVAKGERSILKTNQPTIETAVISV
jgi:diguanylate cyclase (GGDEF)-like protein/PAS domain S-box-containing protein